MKIYMRFFILMSMTTLLFSCTNVTESDLVDPINLDILTFEADILPITRNTCTECHSDPPANGAPMPLVTFDNVVDAIENRGLLNRINNNSAPMPPSGLLPLPTRELIQQWVDDGLLEQ